MRGIILMALSATTATAAVRSIMSPIASRMTRRGGGYAGFRRGNLMAVRTTR